MPRGSALWRHAAGRTGILTGGVLLAIVVIGPLLVGDPDATDYTNQLQPPSAEHWLGTDRAGRDLLARTITGGRSSLGAAVLVMAISTTLGLVVGVIAGTIGGAVDAVITRLIDILLGLPGLVLTLAIVGLLGPGFINLVLAMSLTSWAGLARLARSVAAGSDQRPDVIAARMAGVGTIKVAIGHVLPGATAQLLIAATIGLGEIVLALAGLSFLGLGAQPPTAEWGNMLADSRETLAYAPWQLIGPTIGLAATVLSVTLMSEALRDVTDPGGAR